MTTSANRTTGRSCAAEKTLRADWLRFLFFGALLVAIAFVASGTGQAAASPLSHHDDAATTGFQIAKAAASESCGKYCGRTHGGLPCEGQSQSCAGHCASGCSIAVIAGDASAFVFSDARTRVAANPRARRSLEPPSVFRPPRVA